MKYTKYKYNQDWEVRITIQDPDILNMGREILRESFKNVILEYYGIDHEVDFDKIKRDRYMPGIELVYTFSGIPTKDSEYQVLYDKCIEDENKPIRYAELKQSLTLEEARDRDALSNIYSNMSNGTSDEANKEAWEFVKYFIWYKIKGLFSRAKDGTYWEVQLVDSRMEKLKVFNTPKRKFIEGHLKKRGKTLENFRQASTLWDIQNKEQLKIPKSSMELRTDLATSGLNDKVF